MRASNSVAYHLPSNLGGFYGQVNYALGENVSDAGNRKDGSYLGARLGFATGRIARIDHGLRQALVDRVVRGEHDAIRCARADFA